MIKTVTQIILKENKSIKKITNFYYTKNKTKNVK